MLEAHERKDPIRGDEMVQHKKVADRKPLTAVELEIMNIIWGLGDCTVKDVQRALPKERDLAYTSIATMMKILEQKGVLESIKDDRTHTYSAILSKVDYEGQSLRHLAEHLFQGDPSSMVMRLIDDSKLDHKELEAIRKLLDEKLGGSR